MKIVVDTPALYTPEEGKALGLRVVPSCTLMGNRAYRDFEDISSEELLEKIEQGETPTTSQPSIADVLEAYESCQGEEILALPLGDGLSGTYQNMEAARRQMKHSDQIHVVDTKTLAGPQWYLVQKAMKLRDEGINIEGIKNALQKCIETSVSFVIPQDFNFLKRSGRLTPVAAKIGTLLKIVPILTQTQDKRRITLFSIKRSARKAVEALIEHFKELGVNDKYLITVSHGGVKEKAAEVLEQFKSHFSNSVFEMFTLPPSLITHGGPGCIVIQTIMM